MRNSTASAPAGPGSRSDSDTSNVAPSIARPASRSRTALASLGAAAARARRSPAAALSRSARAAARAVGDVLERDLGALELGAALAAALGVLEHSGDRAAVLALKPVEQGQTLLDGLELAGGGLDALPHHAQLAGQILRLVDHAAGTLGQRIDFSIDPGDPLE